MNKGTNKVIKNTLALYLRMIVLTVISLLTYRVIFQALGASDYGTYNVVGGFVSMFSFVSSIMVTSSQRFFAIGLANNDWEKVNKFFSINIVIYSILCLIILLLGETVGLFFVGNKLNVDYSRKTEILIVYQTSVASFLLGMIISPYRALLVADEMYAIVNIINTVA